MLVSKKLIAGAVGGLLLVASYAPVWAGSGEPVASSNQQGSVVSHVDVRAGGINPGISGAL